MGVVMPRGTGFYIFLLMLVLIMVAYYVGTQSVVSSLSSAFVNIGNMLTGRNAQGQFQSYPGGAAA